MSVIAFGGSPTGSRLIDLLWKVVAGGILGYCGAWASLPVALRREPGATVEAARDLLRPVMVILLISALSLLQLPGPVGTESMVGVVVGLAVIIWGSKKGAATPLLQSRWWKRRRSVVVVSIGAGIAVSATLMTVSAWNVAVSARQARASALLAIDDLKSYEVEGSIGHLEATDRALRRMRDALRQPGGAIMGAIPVVAQFRRYALDMVAPLTELVDAGTVLARARPDRALVVDGGQIDLAALSRIALLFDPVVSASQEVLDVDAARSVWLSSFATRPVDTFLDRARDVHSTMQLSRKVLAQLPWILGEDGKRTFFVPILTPVENRSGGGFPGAFAIMTARNGKLRVEDFGTIQKVATAGNPLSRVITKPLDYVARYQQYGAGDGKRPAKNYFWSNVTASPDHPSVSEVISQLYPQSGGTRVDGVVSIDVRAMAALLQITGPVSLADSGKTIDSDNAEKYLLRDQYFELTSVSNSERRDRVYSAAEAIVRRATSMRLPSPITLARVLGPAVSDGNIRMWFRRPETQALMREIDADGRFGPPTSVASIAVTNTNGGPNKIDLFLRKSIKHRVVVDSAGAVRATTEIRLANAAPPRGVDDYVIGNWKGWPRGTNVMILNYYSPLLDCSATINGKSVSLPTEMELGWLVHSLYFGVPPAAQTTVMISCTGTTDRAGVEIGTPQIRGQVSAIDDEWSVRVSSPDGRWTFDGARNTNKWTTLEFSR